MVGKDKIVMSLEEIRRLKIIQAAIDKRITQKTVASILRISERQVRRVVKVVREEGEGGVIHKSRG